MIQSGTNQLHGLGWTYFQDSAWNANSWEGNRSGTAKPNGTQRWYCGNLGGPVFIPKVYDGRNKTFWFFSFEYTKPGQQFLQQLRILTNAERTGDFSNSSLGVPVINGQPTPQLDPAHFSPSWHSRSAGERICIRNCRSLEKTIASYETNPPYR